MSLFRLGPLLVLLAAGCAGGPPAEEARALLAASYAAPPAAVSAALRSAIEAAGYFVERADERGLATRRREEPEDYAWTLSAVFSPQGAKTAVDAVLRIERASEFRPVQDVLRNSAQMQVDDQYLETKNRKAYERDTAEIDANSPGGRREAALRRLDGRLRAALADAGSRLSPK